MIESLRRLLFLCLACGTCIDGDLPAGIGIKLRISDGISVISKKPKARMRLTHMIPCQGNSMVEPILLPLPQ